MSIGDLSRINTNIQSQQALGQFSKTNAELGMRQLRLATGSRLNRAEDDSAGYSIAKKLESRVRGQAQAMANVGDAKSMLGVAEGTLGSVMDILQTMKEKAVQAANDTLGDSERTSIQNQIDALSSEISDIINTAEFNGTSLFTDDAAGTALDFQVGAESDDSFGVTIDRMSKDALIGAGSTVDTGGLTGGEVTVTGYSGTTAEDYTMTVDLTVDAAGDDAADISAATFTTGSGAFALGQNVEFRATTNAAGGASDTAKAQDMLIEYQDTDGEWQTVADNVDLSAASGGDYTASVNGLQFTIAQSDAAGNDGDWGDGLSFNLNAGGLTDGGAVTYNATTETYTSSDGALSFQGDFTGAIVNDTFDVAADVGGVNVTTNDGARASVDTINTAIQSLADQLGDIGDVQSRLSFKLDNLQTSTTNLDAARSRIEDADFAKEQMEIVKLQILQQTGIASLAQSNAAPQSVLSLLG